MSRKLVLGGNSYKIEYTAEGALGILATVNEHGGITESQDKLNDLRLDCEWENMEKVMGWTRPYSNKIDNISECVMLKDGSILMCWTVSSWDGTFASHDRIEVGYYLLRKV